MLQEFLTNTAVASATLFATGYLIASFINWRLTIEDWENVRMGIVLSVFFGLIIGAIITG